MTEFTKLRREDLDDLEAIHAYDTGARDSGLHDERRRAEVAQALDDANPWEDAEARADLSRWVASAYLSEEAIRKGYGWEDALEYLRWINDGDFRRT
jgi:hypothetical protein